MGTLDSLTGGFIGFVHNTIGIATRPYETYRRITHTQNRWELVYIGLILAIYFATASLVKTAAFRPFLLTKQFIVLGSAAACTYLVASSVLWLLARRLGGTGEYGTLAMGWAYTLIPTLIWFWSTSLLYVLIPPPRTTSVEGITFSIIYLTFSATLLCWKIILGYLTLRFSMKLDLKPILATIFLASPVLAVYGFVMYRLGIFKVPFL